jgi:hypothetical protein
MHETIIEFFKENTATREPDFVKLYLDDIGKLFSIDNNSQRLFGELLKLIDPKEKNIHSVVVLNKAIKNRIAQNLGFTGVDKKGTPNKYLINNYLGKLNKSGLIRRLESDIYIINPFICSKVDWNNTELLRSIHLEITYDHTTRSMITLINTGENSQTIKNQIDLMRKDDETFKYSKEDEEGNK